MVKSKEQINKTSAQNSPLEGLRLLDISRAPESLYRTMLHHDMGEDVIMVERDNGGNKSRVFNPVLFSVDSFSSNPSIRLPIKKVHWRI